MPGTQQIVSADPQTARPAELPVRPNKHITRYFKNTFKNDEDVLNNLKALQIEYPENDNIMPIFVNSVFIESLNWVEKTGEWLVYKKFWNKYKFLCLYLHDPEDKNDENLFSLIKDEI